MLSHKFRPCWSARALSFCSRPRCIAPLGSRARIGQAAKQIHQRVPVAWKGGYFARVLRLEFRSELRQLRVRHTGVPVMHAMIWLVEQSESYQPAKRTLRHDTAGGTVH